MALNKAANRLLSLPRTAKRIFALLVDAGLCVLTVKAAFYLRLDGWTDLTGSQWIAVVTSPLLALPLFVWFGLYRAIFRFAGAVALLSVVQAMLAYAVLYALIFAAIGVPDVPRTIGLIQPILLLMAVGGMRLLARYWLGGLYQVELQKNRRSRVLIYGAGVAGRQLAAAMESSLEVKVMGFIDDEVSLQGRSLNGLRVYRPKELLSIVSKMDVTDILLAVPSISRRRRNEILDELRLASVNVRTIPGLVDLAKGRVEISDLRELDIEDLLGRESVAPNQSLLMKNINQQVVMVTGAGGSIGSELCREIIKAQPQVLLLVEQSEFALYAIYHDLLSKLPPDGAVRIVSLLASVRDYERISEIVRTWQPHTIYHAAAYKHVPIVEHNPAEGIKNNAGGTLNVARVASEQCVKQFVLVSTDKAVRPTNIMGASKRLAELILQALADRTSRMALATGNTESGGTNFCMVRFGNVLGSSGSVVPLFRQQIKNGGPITLTHADITRYFMTIPEAAQLVIQAGAMAEGGDVFVLDMGDPVKIIDLARRMIALSGLTQKDDEHPDGDIEIVVTGMRPGEKLYEELLIGDNPMPTDHPLIMKAHEHYLPWEKLEPELQLLDELLESNDVPQIKSMLQKLVPGYVSNGSVVDWVHLENEQCAR